MQAAPEPIDYKERFEEREVLIAELNNKLLAATLEPAQLKGMLFGARRERFIPAANATTKDLQLALDLNAETIAQCKITAATKVECIRTQAE